MWREGESQGLLKAISEGNLERKYGGVGNAPKTYWPPDFPLASVFLPTEDPGKSYPAAILNSTSVPVPDSPIFIAVPPRAVQGAAPTDLRISLAADDPETPPSGQQESSGGRTPGFEPARIEVENPFERLRSEVSMERDDSKLACASCSFDPKSTCSLS